ncbi:cationic amino acid transporter 8, vacuolar [Tanacetum coccineum]
MKKCLSWVDLIWLGFGSVVGSGIFTIAGLEARDDVGPSMVVSYVVSGLSALFSVFCYTEFSVEVPIAGNEINTQDYIVLGLVPWLSSTSAALSCNVSKMGLRFPLVVISSSRLTLLGGLSTLSMRPPLNNLSVALTLAKKSSKVIMSGSLWNNVISNLLFVVSCSSVFVISELVGVWLKVYAAYAAAIGGLLFILLRFGHHVAIKCWVFIGRVFLDNYGFGLDGNLGWRNSWLNEDPAHLERAVLHGLVTYFLLRSDHRLVVDHENRPMGIFWNLYMSLMYADDVTFAEFSLCAKDLQVFSWSIQFLYGICYWYVSCSSAFGINGSLGVLCWIVISANGLSACLRFIWKLLKSPQCIIVLLTHGFLACNLLHGFWYF